MPLARASASTASSQGSCASGGFCCESLAASEPSELSITIDAHRPPGAAAVEGVVGAARRRPGTAPGMPAVEIPARRRAGAERRREAGEGGAEGVGPDAVGGVVRAERREDRQARLASRAAPRSVRRRPARGRWRPGCRCRAARAGRCRRASRRPPRARRRGCGRARCACGARSAQAASHSAWPATAKRIGPAGIGTGWPASARRRRGAGAVAEDRPRSAPVRGSTRPAPLRAEEPRPTASASPLQPPTAQPLPDGVEQQREDRVALQRPVVAGAGEGGALLVLPAVGGLAQQVAVARQARTAAGSAAARWGPAPAGRRPAGRRGAAPPRRSPAPRRRRARPRRRSRSSPAAAARRSARASPGAVALDHDVAPGGDGAAVGQAGDGEELRAAAADAVEQRVGGGVDPPAAAVVDEQVAAGGDDRLAAGEGDRGEVGALEAGRQRFLLPALAVAEQDAALADRVAAIGVGRVEGDVHQVAFEADRDAGVGDPEVVARVPLPHRPEVADRVGARGLRPGDAAQGRLVDAAARGEQELALPAAAGHVAGDRSRRRRPPARRSRASPAAPPGAAVTSASGARSETGHGCRRRAAAVFGGDLDRALEPAAVGAGEGAAGAEVAAAAGHPREGAAVEAQVGAAVAVLAAAGVERVGDDAGAEAAPRPGEAAVAALARELDAERPSADSERRRTRSR